MFKLISALTFIVIFPAGAPAAAPASPGESLSEKRAEISLDGTWKITKPEKTNRRPSVGEAVKSGFFDSKTDTRNWIDCQVPAHTWHAQFPETYPDSGKLGAPYQFTGAKTTYTDAWYSKDFFLPGDLKDSRILLEFGSIGWESHIWVNGKKAGEHKGSFTGFSLDITDKVEFGKENDIKIWCYNDFGESPPRHTYGKMFFQQANIGGIHGGVKITARPPVYVKRCLITPNIQNGSAGIDTEIVNTGKNGRRFSAAALTRGGLAGNYGKAERHELGDITARPGSSSHVFTVKLDRPELWTPEKPFLYEILIILHDKDGGAEEVYKDRFGMREFTAKDAKFFLNGKRVRIFCGNVTTQGAWDRWDSGNLKSREDLRRQKSQGANAVRYHMAGADSHKFLAMCDEEGILAASEFPMFHRVFSELTFTGAPRKEFMDNTLYEWKERLLRDYNHPSCALWSLSNEVWTDSTADELNELYDALKPMDKQNRPMSADSGAHSFGIPTLPLHTDFWDAHLYNVLSYLPPALAYKDFDRYYEDLKKIYGNLSKPSAAFEAVEFAGHKPPQIIPAERNLSADEYLELLKACPWGDKNVTGLRYYLAWAGNGAVFADKVAKETFEEFRKETRLQAIHPWFGPRTYICPSYKIISNPVFIGAARLPGNQFAGKPFAFDIVIVKDDLGKASADVTLTLAGKNGDVMAVRDFKFELPENQDKTTGAVAIDIPPRTESGACRIFLDVKTDRGGSNRNYYDINILNPKDLPELKPGAGKIALVEPDQKAAETFAKIFDRFAVGYERVNSVERLPDFTHLLINTGAEGKTLWEELSQKHGGKIHDWVTKGGRLLINEVPVSSSLDFIFDGYSVKKSSGTDLVSAAMEPVIREHPVFKGLSFESFEHMSGDGIVADSLISPLSPNILATAPVYGKDGGMLMCEAKIGKGSCLVSQVRALERSGKDSSAALLLRNMLGYFTGPELCKEVKELKKNEKTGLLLFYDKLDKGDFQPLDISGAANRSFRDDTAGDGKGGWTDAGGSDLRHAPSGEQKYFGIPFNIIPSPSESDRAVIILKSQRTPSFPEKSTPVKIGGKIRRLFLLHTAMYPENGSAAYTITVNYADGSKSEIPVIAADSIGDWFNPRNQKNALTAWAERHPLINFPFGFYLACFDIPEPGKTVGSVEFSNKDGGATPVIIAATAQKYNELAENVLGKSWSFSDKDNVRLMGTKTTRPEPGKFEGAEHFWLAPDLKGASIDASKWKRLMFRMRSSAPVSVKILYIAGADNATSQTLSPVRTDKDGWQYFDTDLGSSSLVWPHGSSVQARQWGGASKKISSFGIDIYPKEITTVEFGPVTLFKD